MLTRLLVAGLVLWSANALANEECTTRIVTDKIYDVNGASIVSEQSRTSCGHGGSKLLSLVGIDDRCYYYNVRGQKQLACQYPNGNWVTFGDTVDSIDSFSGETSPQTGKYSAQSNYYENTGSLVTLLVNFTKWRMAKLDDESKQLHERAVYLALENADNGQIVTWTNRKQTEMGRIKIVSTLPVQGGVCRRMLVELTVGNNVRNLSETACNNFSTENWHFIE